MQHGSRLERFWARAATLLAGLSAGAMAVWWLSPRTGRGAGSEGSPRLDSLQSRLEGVSGAARVCLRDLGAGIVEAFGEAPDAEAVERVVAALREEPGVSFVVNRIWTPASAEVRSADLTHSPRKRSQA
jgi:hypothetical protein